MADKVPVKGGYNGGSLTGIAEYATGDTLGVAHGGTGVVTIGSNQLLTGNGTSALTSESNLTFDGTILKATGDLCATVKVVSPALCIGSEYVLPTADGSAGQIMCTNGSGALAFATATAGVTLAGSTNNTIATVTGSNALAGEANLTFDGSLLTVGSTGQKAAEIYSSNPNPYLVIAAEAETQNDTAGIAFHATKGQTIGSANTIAQIVGKVTNSGGTLKGDMIFYTNGGDQEAERMRIDSSGNVGLGTATPTGPASRKLVQITGAGTEGVGLVMGPATAVSNALVGSMSFYSGAGEIVRIETGTENSVTNDGAISFDTATSGTVTRRMTINSSGNVGIGTTSPSGKVHIQSASSGGSVHANVDELVVEGSGASGIQILSGSSAGGGIFFGDSGSNVAGSIQYDHGGPDSMNFYTAAAATPAMRITCAGQIRINTTDDYAQLEVGSSDANGTIRMLQSGNASIIQAYGWCTNYAGTIQQNIVGVNYSSGAYSYGGLDNQGSNWHMKIRSDGNGYIDQTWHNGGADYAEYWESTDGTRLDVGKTVVLDGNKVRYYNAEIDTVDDIFGVTRPRTDEGGSAGVIGNAQWSYWQGRYKTDDFGRWIKGDRVRLEWEDSDNPNNDRSTAEGKYSYYEDEIPEGVTPPADAVRTVEHVRIPNDDFDPSLEYVAREERDEWQIIGIIGQIPIIATETVNPKWKKQRDISDATHEYYVG